MGSVAYLHHLTAHKPTTSFLLDGGRDRINISTLEAPSLGVELTLAYEFRTNYYLVLNTKRYREK